MCKDYRRGARGVNGGACDVMVIVLGNGIGNKSSNG